MTNKTRILTTARARAVYNAICALDAIGANLGETLIPIDDGRVVVVAVQRSGSVGIASPTGAHERYASHSAFADAYWLLEAGA